VFVRGMLGLGDNIHQRGIIKELMKHEKVWLETPWPCIYHDLVGDRLSLTYRKNNLRTQHKNAIREMRRFSSVPPKEQLKEHKVWYTHQKVIEKGSFFAAMCDNSKVPKGDFSMPVPEEWKNKARKLVGRRDKPILFYRPLVERKEWNGCKQRNPDAAAYVEILNKFRQDYFVVSVADLVPSVEWEVSASIRADKVFHRGELDIESIAGMMAISDLVYCSAGFSLVMSQAVGANMIAVFGGHESSRLYNHGFKNNLFIDPINPCECFSKVHACNKRIDIKQAEINIKEFLHDINKK
jgi:ADP-heptose:LPS heptosyltransferase